MSDVLVGPNPCHTCGGEYGNHDEGMHKMFGKPLNRRGNNVAVGYTQPSIIFCPNGHVMTLVGKGSIETLRGYCVSRTCEHFRIVYRVVLPTIRLEVVEDMNQ